MQFVPIRVNTIRSTVPLLFDVYVNYKDTYVKYKSSQDIFEEELITKFKDKKIKKIFVPAEQESLYLKYLDTALNQLNQNSIAVENRAAFAQDAMKTESENIEKNLETEEAFKSTQDRIWKVVSFIANEPKSLALMLSAAGISVDDTEHASTVSTIALSLAVQVDIVDQDELTAIAVAALLHDSALKKLGFSPTAQITEFTGDQRSKFKTHPAVAVEQVAGKKYITPRTLRIIADHEEFGDGQGFPEKKRIGKLQLSSQIFNLSDAFDHHCMLKKLSQKEAIDAFIEERQSHYELAHIELLEKLIKV